MNKKMMRIIIIFTAFSTVLSHAESNQVLPNAYEQCVEQTIDLLKLGNINNAVVESCSNKTKTVYAKQIVQLLDKIKKQSTEDQQPERYSDIMKSQQLWKNYIDQECHNAGAYIGSPMYEFCPMQKYAERVEQLKEYIQ